MNGSKVPLRNGRAVRRENRRICDSITASLCITTSCIFPTVKRSYRQTSNVRRANQATHATPAKQAKQESSKRKQQKARQQHKAQGRSSIHGHCAPFNRRPMVHAPPPIPFPPTQDLSASNRPSIHASIHQPPIRLPVARDFLASAAHFSLRLTHS